MKKVINQFNLKLVDIAWSLWTELGVQGLHRNHKDYFISIEELIILTCTLCEIDPRLRDESLDWCLQFNNHISTTRLKFLALRYKEYVGKEFSIFANIIYSQSKITGKSVLRDLKNPAMINFRIRGLFGSSAKADIITFLLNEENKNFFISDFLEIGYSKRHVAGTLGELAASGILSEIKIRNHFQYYFIKKNQFIELIGGVPEKKIHWHRVLDIFLPLQVGLNEIKDAPEAVKVVEIRNILIKIQNTLELFHLKPPSLLKDFQSDWSSLENWLVSLPEKICISIKR